MSRSKKGKKSPDSEHWSKRPKSFENSKKLTVRAERKESKEEIKNQLEALDLEIELNDQRAEKLFQKKFDLMTKYFRYNRDKTKKGIL